MITELRKPDEFFFFQFLLVTLAGSVYSSTDVQVMRIYEKTTIGMLEMYYTIKVLHSTKKKLRISYFL
jgi:hypothetical protein